MKKQPVVSIVGKKLVAAMVVEEEVTAPASNPFATKGPSQRGCYYYDGTSVHVNAVPNVMDVNTVISDETINDAVKEITDGIPEAKASAIRDSIVSGVDVVDSDNLFVYIPTTEDEDEIKTIYNTMMEQLEAMRSNGGNIDSKLKKYMFKKHLLIQGEKGGGKTYMVSKLLDDIDDDVTKVTLRGNEAIEAIDMLGHYIRTETGGLVWKDGPLTTAFRAAKEGKAVLFIDEMLRIPKRQLNVLVGCMSPDSKGNLTLDTSRAATMEVEDDSDGIVQSEVITVPKENLWFIGTTNAGAGYAVDQIDEALADRVRVIIKRMGEKEMKKILENVATEHGHSKKTAAKLIKFYKSFNALRESGELVKLVNLRHLAEILEFSDTDDILDAAMDLIPTWCTQDQAGYPNETQSSIIEGIIEKELV